MSGTMLWKIWSETRIFELHTSAAIYLMAEGNILVERYNFARGEELNFP